ncbi:5269_t:CDS:1, partial [Funneliformis mosseae]
SVLNGKAAEEKIKFSCETNMFDLQFFCEIQDKAKAKSSFEEKMLMIFFDKFIASSQYITLKSLVFKPSVSDKEEVMTYLEISLNPFERGTANTHDDKIVMVDIMIMLT